MADQMGHDYVHQEEEVTQNLKFAKIEKWLKNNRFKSEI